MITRIAPATSVCSFGTSLATGKRTFHEVVVLSDLLWCFALLDVGEQSHEDVFGKWPDICLVEAASSAELTSRLETYSACRSLLMKRIRSIVIAA
jgi:hypothetical protein